MPGVERRQQLLDTARTIFVRDGYRATTGDVAQAAGVSEALVVKHFGTKEGLFRAAVLDPIVVVVEDALAEGRRFAAELELGDPAHHLARLQSFGTTWAALVQEHQALFFTVLRESAAFPDDVAHLTRLLRELIDDLARLLERFSGSAGYEEFDARMTVYAALGAVTVGALLGDDPAVFAKRYFEMTFIGLLTPKAQRGLRR
jgi:AcrR family transcriptional regulator